jgi:hypothetical protein
VWGVTVRTPAPSNIRLQSDDVARRS